MLLELGDLDVTKVMPLEPIAKAQVAWFVASSVIFFCSILWLPVVGLPVGFLTPFPSSLALYLWGVPKGFIVPLLVVLVGMIVLGLWGILIGLPYLCMLVIMGSLIGLYARLGKGFDFSLIVPTFVGFLLMLLMFVLRHRHVEGSVWNYMEERLFQFVVSILKEYESGKNLVTPYLKEQIRNSIRLLISLLPGITFGSLLFMSSLNALMLKKRVEKRGFAISSWPPFSMWRSKEWLVWIVIGAGFLALVHGTTGLNILIALGVLYLLQGLAIYFYFAQKWGFHPWLKFFGALLILFQQYFTVIVALIGFFDVWFDFRKIATREVQ